MASPADWRSDQAICGGVMRHRALAIDIGPQEIDTRVLP